jgi:hypothetical protein
MLMMATYVADAGCTIYQGGFLVIADVPMMLDGMGLAATETLVAEETTYSNR